MKISIANQVTIGRLLLAVVFFALLGSISPAHLERDRWIFAAAFWLFLIAALSDVLDGYLARTLHQVTAFGRVLDPVVDKVVVCGAFIYFASSHFHRPGAGNITGVDAWMVVVMLTRELLVSALRSVSEQSGQDFGAQWSGKLKMFVQSTTVCIVLGGLAWYHDNAGFQLFARACIWLTVSITALSIVGYLRKGWKLVFSAEALGGSSQAPRPASAPEEPRKLPTLPERSGASA